MIEIPNIPLEEFEVPTDGIASTLGLKNTYTGSLDFGIIGSGQCGGRLVKSFYEIGYKKAVAINTAIADLNPLEIPVNQKLKIGDLEGSGKSMEKGGKAAQESAQAIFDKMKAVFGTVDKIIICVGFGGGTGAGSCPVLISIAKKYLSYIGNPNPKQNIIIIAALPTSGELKSVVVNENNESVKKMMYQIAEQNEVGPIILIDNSKIEKLYRGIPPVKFWPTINDTITKLFQIFNYLSKQESGYTSFDKEDYKTVLTTPGLAVLGVTKVEIKEGTELSSALQNNLKKTLLADMVDYATAKEAACVVVAGDKLMETMSMDDINYGFDTIANLINNANVHRGLYDTDGDAIRAYTLITGMKTKSTQEK
jgi:cell division GTPase FtsZ